MKKMDKKPLISVMMPVYNGSKYMAEAIDSILNQTYKNIELIIINDNSTDSTLEILNSYKRSFPKIKIVNLRSNLGPFRAVNIALKYAKGDFIAPMDCDDVSHPKRLEKEVQFMLGHKNVIVVGTHARIIDSEGKVVGQKTFAIKDKDIRRQFFEVHPIVHPSCMIRRSLLPNKNCIYYPDFGINSDYFTFFRLIKHGKFANIGQLLFDYRIHLGNNSLQGLKEKFLNTVKIRFFAVFKLGYKPSVSSLFKFFGQIFVALVVPESKLLTLYLISKRIYAPKDILSGFVQKINLSVKSIPYYLFRTS